MSYESTVIENNTCKRVQLIAPPAYYIIRQSKGSIHIHIHTINIYHTIKIDELSKNGKAYRKNKDAERSKTNTQQDYRRK